MAPKRTYWLHSKPTSEASQYDLLTNTELRVTTGGLSKMAVNWLQNLLITNKLLDPVLFLRSVSRPSF